MSCLNHPLDQVEPGARGGGEVEMPPLRSGMSQPLGHRRGFVSRQVLQHNIDVEVAGDVEVDQLEEPEDLFGAVPWLGVLDRLPGGHVGPPWEDRGSVFVREDGSFIYPDAFSKVFNNRVERAGLPRIRLHDLRHTHATLVLQPGIHHKVVSERLGHATIAITLDTYSHAIRAMEKDAAEQVAALVFGD